MTPSLTGDAILFLLFVASVYSFAALLVLVLIAPVFSFALGRTYAFMRSWPRRLSETHRRCRAGIWLPHRSSGRDDWCSLGLCHRYRGLVHSLPKSTPRYPLADERGNLGDCGPWLYVRCSNSSLVGGTLGADDRNQGGRPDRIVHWRKEMAYGPMALPILVLLSLTPAGQKLFGPLGLLAFIAVGASAPALILRLPGYAATAASLSALPGEVYCDVACAPFPLRWRSSNHVHRSGGLCDFLPRCRQVGGAIHLGQQVQRRSSPPMTIQTPLITPTQVLKQPPPMPRLLRNPATRWSCAATWTLIPRICRTRRYQRQTHDGI